MKCFPFYFFCICFQCNLVPTDEITVYYTAKSEGNYLSTIIESHMEFIFATIKVPLKPYPVATSDKILIQEKMQVSSVELLRDLVLDFMLSLCARILVILSPH